MKRYKRLGERYAELRKKVDSHNPRTSYGEFFTLYSEIVRAHNRKEISDYEYDFLVNILMRKRGE